MNTPNLITVFFTGLVTGGLTCLAVQGGLLASLISQKEALLTKEIEKKRNNALPILVFLISKLGAYTLLGFLLGWFGSLFQMSLTLRLIMQIGVAIFMLGTGLNILHVSPIFRYFVITPPKFLFKFVRNQSKSTSFFAPILLGAFTIFIPCGTTQAMMALAVGTANPLFGAAILFAFILGTSPLFFILGFAATKLGELAHERFMKMAAFTLILLAIFNLNSAIALSGSKWTLETIVGEFWCTISVCKVNASNTQSPASENQTITFEANKYAPSEITVAKGTKVKLNLVNKNGAGCIQAFTIPKLGISKIVPVGTSSEIEFVAPDRPQQIAFMCSMGMYRGIITVI